MRPTRADHAMGGKNVFISHFPISLSLSFSFSFHPPHPSMNSPAFESSSRPRAMSFAEGRGFKSGNILSLSLPLSNIRYESGTTRGGRERGERERMRTGELPKHTALGQTGDDDEGGAKHFAT